MLVVSKLVINYSYYFLPDVHNNVIPRDLNGSGEFLVSELAKIRLVQTGRNCCERRSINSYVMFLFFTSFSPIFTTVSGMFQTFQVGLFQHIFCFFNILSVSFLEFLTTVVQTSMEPPHLTPSTVQLEALSD